MDLYWRYTFLLPVLLFVLSGEAIPQEYRDVAAAKPLFRDPVFDGAADPVVIRNRKERKWFMFYTNRRAAMEEGKGVEWVHGTRIGIAESSDSGHSWKYRGTANIRYGDSTTTFWAPEVIFHRGTYHMYLTVVPGIFSDWNAPRSIIHLISRNLLDWDFVSVLELASNKVIDACVIRQRDGTWRMWYKNERAGSRLYTATSNNLSDWSDQGVAISGHSSEGPVVFSWGNRYWLICDVWDGLRVYSSTDLVNWMAQEENLLKQPGTSPTDMFKGQHADVVVNNDRAWLFYFVHQYGEEPALDNRDYGKRTVIQVAELNTDGKSLMCDRDVPVLLKLKPSIRKKGKNPPR